MIPGLVMLVTSFLAVAGIVLIMVAIAHFFARFQPPITFPVLFSWRWTLAEVLFYLSAYLGMNILCLSFVVHPSVLPHLVPASLDIAKAPIPTKSDPPKPDEDASSEANPSPHVQARAIGGLWSGVFAMGGLVALFLWLSTLRESKRRISSRLPSWKVLQAAGLAWLVIAPSILALNVCVNSISQYFQLTPEVHPLATIGSVPGITLIFLLSSCVAAPVMEELLVRGVLLPWACRSLKNAGVLFIPAFLLAALGRASSPLGPLSFFGLLVIGYGALLKWGPKREGSRRRMAAIYSTSALFALAHSSVWPTPIPLFAFSLGLSWLALRTGGVTAPIIVHGLLNLVSSIYVLRGGPL
ncbi:MAG: CPBP family intramembrane glutamic endopeptidase [Gemmataceae bacterium]